MGERTNSYYQQTQPFPFQPYPSNLSTNSSTSNNLNNNNTSMMKPDQQHSTNTASYLANLQSQLRSTGQVNSDLLRQHVVISNGLRSNSNTTSRNSSNLSVGGNSQPQSPNGNWGNTNYTLNNNNNNNSNASIQSAANVLVPLRPRRISTPPLSSNEGEQEVEEKSIKSIGKRGRKKKVSPEHEIDSGEDEEGEEETGPRKKERRGSLNANEKRKLQNRAAQRAFRERKEKRVTDLEDKVGAQHQQLEIFREMMQTLQTENAALRRGEKVSPSMLQIPPALQHESPQDTSSSTSEQDQLVISPPPPRHQSPPDIKPKNLSVMGRNSNVSRRASQALPTLEIPTIIASLPTYSYAQTTEARAATSEATITSTLTLARTPISMERGSGQFGAETPDDGFRTYNSRSQQQQFNAQLLERQQQTGITFNLASPYPTSSSRPDISRRASDINFDFEAPFDFSTSVPLPPLFQDLYDQAFPTTPSVQPQPNTTSTASLDSPQYFSSTTSNTISTAPSEVEVDMDENHDEIVTNHDRLPCNKPECDFSVVSCELPQPWRPQTTTANENESWACQQSWAKLASHPMFSECDVDDLCRELRDKTVCNQAGQLVIVKSDVFAIFRSIPSKAMLRRNNRNLQV